MSIAIYSTHFWWTEGQGRMFSINSVPNKCIQYVIEQPGLYNPEKDLESYMQASPTEYKRQKRESQKIP